MVNGDCENIYQYFFVQYSYHKGQLQNGTLLRGKEAGLLMTSRIHRTSQTTESPHYA